METLKVPLAAATAAATTEELSTTIRPHPIMRRDSISRSGNPSLRYIYIYIYIYTLDFTRRASRGVED